MQMPLINISGIDVDFPFIPYALQIDYMTKVIEALQSGQNAVLESPTGTGKTLCLLCASLGWRKAEIAKLASVPSGTNEFDEGAVWQDHASENFGFKVPKVIYASRTHSQLTQVVKELKHTSYGKSIGIAVLGSREQMCVHHEVSKQTNNQIMVHMCRNKVNKRLCQFYNNVESSMRQNIFTRNIMDIEDLVTVGKKVSACPYYAAREASKQAECGIIFMPYNYLLDKRSRHSHNIEVGGNIIIFDEAHNLEKHCEESASFDLTSLDLAHCIEEVGDLLNAVTKMCDTGVVADGHEAGESSALSDFDKEELAILKKCFLSLEKQLDEIELPKSKSKSELGKFIFEYFAKVNLTFDTYDLLLNLLEKVTNYLSTLSNPFRTRGASLQKFCDVIKIVFNASSEIKTIQHFGIDATAIRDELSRYYRVHISEDDKKMKEKDIWKRERTIVTKPNRTLSYWCFSPGYAMKELVRSGVRNLILTSGTLSPIQTFTAELQVDFPITLENSHVIEKYQIFVASLSVGIFGGKLESTYKARSDEQKLQELGRTVIEILKLSPGGALVFFPSYAAMDHYVTAWKENSNIMEMCELSKPCTVEPRRKTEMQLAIQKYYQDVKSPEGGALFAVCRGKVSEGLDFANDNGRTVIIVGIPFPPSKDPKVQLKMSFLDDMKRNGAENVIPGNDWYRQQACRAVNQAIGRVIRHRYDYGAIVLCDYRYSRKDQIEELPKWVQSHVSQFEDCPKFLRRLKSFFCSAKEKEKLRVGLREIEEKSKMINNSDNQGEKASSSGHISFATTQEFLKKIPKFNELEIHVPSMGCPWWERMQRAAALAAKSNNQNEYTSVNASKRKRSPEPSTSSEVNRIGLLDALDSNQASDISNEDASPDMFEDKELNAPSYSYMTDLKRLENSKTLKRKKIKIKPNLSSQKKQVSTLNQPSTCKEQTNTTANLKFTGAEFLNSLKQNQSSENYLKFKHAVVAYRKSGDLNALIEELAESLLSNPKSREYLRDFVKFVRPKHQEAYKKTVESRIAEADEASIMKF